MIGVSWNYRGIGNPRKVLTICELNNFRKPDLFFLIETKSNSIKIELLRCKLGLEDAFSVDSMGCSEGLAFLWWKAANFSMMNYSQHHIDIEVTEASGRSGDSSGSMANRIGGEECMNN